MNAFELVYNRFIKPLQNKRTGNIGVELEFPMLNMDKKPVDQSIAISLLQYFSNDGFKIAEYTTDGQPAFIENSFGDVLSFDNSYNNFEFSMNYGDDLMLIAKRFYSYFEKANNFLQKHNYLITGMGTNPYKSYIEQSHVNYPVYNMVDEFLHNHGCAGRHSFPDFPAYLSSVQTHLDIYPKDVAKTFNFLAKIAFARVLLFGNSPGLCDEKVLCYRDYLWENSAFGCVGGITGKVDSPLEDFDGIADSFLNRKIFNRIRNGKYEVFEPVNLKDYFEQEKYGPEEKDMEQFLSFRDVEITYRGTVEVRGDCAQPAHSAFMPPAFNLGIIHNIDEGILLTEKFFADNKITFKNSELRDCAIQNGSITGVKNSALSQYLQQLVSAAEKGLTGRNKGEQALISGLDKRAEDISCPAKKIIDGQAPIEDIIRMYSATSV